jgi:hypothetical protein
MSESKGIERPVESEALPDDGRPIRQRADWDPEYGAVRPPVMPDLEPVPEVSNIQIYARIKKSSKYYHQGLMDVTDRTSERLFFKLQSFVVPWKPDFSLHRDSYSLRLNNNNYRLEDVELYLRDSKDLKRFIRIL